MKKALIIPITFSFITFLSCGGKDMNGSADYSNRGPDYFDPDYRPHADTNTVGAPKPFSQTPDMGEHTMDSGEPGKEKSIVRGGKE